MLYYDGTTYIYGVPHPDDHRDGSLPARTHAMPYIPPPPAHYETKGRQTRVCQMHALQDQIYDTAVEFAGVGWDWRVALGFHAGMRDYVMEVRRMADRGSSSLVKFEGLLTLEYISRVEQSCRHLTISQDPSVEGIFGNQLLEACSRICLVTARRLSANLRLPATTCRRLTQGSLCDTRRRWTGGRHRSTRMSLRGCSLRDRRVGT